MARTLITHAQTTHTHARAHAVWYLRCISGCISHTWIYDDCNFPSQVIISHSRLHSFVYLLQRPQVFMLVTVRCACLALTAHDLCVCLCVCVCMHVCVYAAFLLNHSKAFNMAFSVSIGEYFVELLIIPSLKKQVWLTIFALSLALAGNFAPVFFSDFVVVDPLNVGCRTNSAHHGHVSSWFKFHAHYRGWEKSPTCSGY